MSGHDKKTPVVPDGLYITEYLLNENVLNHHVKLLTGYLNMVSLAALKPRAIQEGMTNDKKAGSTHRASRHCFIDCSWCTVGQTTGLLALLQPSKQISG